MLKPPTHLIYNPLAGGQDPERDLDVIRSFLCQRVDTLVIWETTPDQFADALVQQAIAQGTQQIIVSGGDGTLSLAARALVGTEIPLGLIPQGTMNAFASALGVPRDLEAACEVLLTGQIQRIDVARCNDIPMLLLMGIGVEAGMIEETAQSAKEFWGPLAYVPSAIRQLRSLSPFEVRMEIEGWIVETSVVALTVANAAAHTSILAQGPAEIVPDDGLLDVTLISVDTIPQALSTSYALLRSAQQGQSVDSQHVSCFRTDRIKISTHPPQKIVIDGELTEITEVEVICIPASLSVIVPQTETEPTEAETDRQETSEASIVEICDRS